MGRISYLLDSNILSEPARLTPDDNVLQQLANHDGEYAKELARLQRQGLTCAYANGEIAAIAVTQKLTLVTRNTQDFQNFQNLALQNWFE
jgi:tRNA(fMet)-specific endonuclease VapC